MPRRGKSLMSVLFGPVMQNGYVVPDLERAMCHWTEVVGVGPFFVLEHIQWSEVFLRGDPVAIDMSVGVAQWGAVQVELVQQHDATPSIYREFAALKGSGLQHVGVMTDDIDAHLARLRSQGIEPVQWGGTANGIRFAYVSTDAHPGGMIELIERGPAIEGFFGLVREAAQNWDGRDPIRRVR